MEPLLDWSDLQTFLAIARHGTLSAAGRAVGVGQTTMGRRLDALERRSGAQLLLKTPRGFVLTPSGEAILGNVERIEAESQAIARRITGREMRLEGQVRLTTVESLAVEILLPALGGLRDRHPGITLDIVANTRSLSLSMREADIALRVAAPRQNDLAVRRVGTLAYGLYASAAYLDRHGMPDFPAGGAAHALVQNEADLMGLPEMAWLAAILPAAWPALRSNSRFVQRAAAAAGLGIACLARYLGDGAGLVRLAPPSPPPRRELWLAVHNDTRHTPRIRAVTDFLAATLRARASTLAPDD
ncbi:MAG: LysR family transcriptional regulator [Rhodospirillales bacterium]|nr:LysR family transcriptional regulator [Rhodospirillales bacterium]